MIDFNDKRMIEFSLNPPAAPDTIEKLLLGTPKLPDDYIDFLRQSNGGEGPIGEAYVALWAAEDLHRLNVEYAVSKWAPGLFVFGSDGGGEAFAFDTRSEVAGDYAVVSVPFVGMSHQHCRLIAGNFTRFLDIVA